MNATALVAEQLLRDYVMMRLRRERRTFFNDDMTHLANCPETVVDAVHGKDGFCGEGTCEMAYFEYALSCPHRQKTAEWTDSRSLAEVLAEMGHRADVAAGVEPFLRGHRFKFGSLGECTITNCINSGPPFLYKVRLPSGNLADVPHDAILKIAGVDGAR